MTHHHLHPRKVDADAHHGRRVAVPQHVRREVGQAETLLPHLQDARRQSALAAADEGVVGLLAVDQSGDRLAKHLRNGLVAVVSLPVDEQRRCVAVLDVVAHAQPAELRQPQAGEEQQQHHVSVEPRLRHPAPLDAPHDRQHLVAREGVVAVLPHLRGLDGRQRVAVDVAACDGQSEQAAGDLQLLAVEGLRLHLALALPDVGDKVAVLHLVQRPVVAPHSAEDGEVLAVVVERVGPSARLAQLVEQQGARRLHRQDRGRLVASLVLQIVEAAGVGAGFLSSPERRPVVAPPVRPHHGTEAAPVSTNVARQLRAVLFHAGRVPTMGAREQENATESGDSVAKSMDWCEERDPPTRGANGLLAAAQREGITSPLTPSDQGGFGPKGAKLGASLGRTSWGPTEADLACGYARCATGCKAPPVLQVSAAEWLCAACADAMQQVAGGVA